MSESYTFADYLANQWSDDPQPLHDIPLPLPGDVIDAGLLPTACTYRPWHVYKITSHRCWNDWKAGGQGTCSLALAPSARHRLWWCSSLREAATHYSWWNPPATGGFSSLSSDLQQAMANGDVCAAAKLCHLIFDWGGVARTASNKSRQWIWDEEAAGTLIASLQRAALALHPNAPAAVVAATFGTSLPMNSATTKLYAAADSSGSGLIFDGRVGAALCLLVREHLRSRGLTAVPPDLEFYWGPAQNNLKARDPSMAPFKFRNVNSVKDPARAQASHRANVLAEAFRKRTGVDARTFEMALFMVGYSVWP